MVDKRRDLPEAKRAPASPDGHQRKRRALEDGRPMSVDLPTPPRPALYEAESMDVDEEPAQQPETPQTDEDLAVEGVQPPGEVVGDHEHDVETALIPEDTTLILKHMLPVLSSQPRIVTPSATDALDFEWRVVWYPNGFVDSDYVSVFVQLVTDEGELQPGESEIVRHAEIEVTLVNEKDPSGKSNYTKISAAHSFCRESPEFGIDKFVRRSKLLDPEKGFLAHDSRVRVTISLNFVVPDPIIIATDDSALSAERDAMALAAHALGLGPHAVTSLEAASTALEDDRDSAESVQHLLAYDSKQETGMVGLKNQGATCYLNSLLQTLFHLRAFREVVYDTPTQNEDTTNSVSLALQRVFYRLQVQNKAVSTKELTRSFGWSQIDSFMQHDVQELYRILCDRLEEKMKNTNVDSTIKKLFEGKVRSFVRCVDVDFQSFRDESFYDLQLDVKGCKDIYQSLRKYVEIELLQGDNQYEADGYGKQDAKKGVSFLQMPPVLNIQLKRYEYDPMRDGMFKIHDRFEFPKMLVLDEFLQNEEGLDPSPDHSFTKDNGTTKSKHVYHLHSVLVHSGDVHGGHYYVFIRPGKDISNSSDWFRFDDDQITRVDESVAIEGNFGSAPSTAIDSSRPSSPLSLGGGSREESSIEFRSMDAPTPEAKDATGTSNDVYEYNKDDGLSSGPRPAPFLSTETSTSSSLSIPLVRSFSSAYMLVYVRDGNNDISAIVDSIKAKAVTGSQDVEMTEPTGEADGDVLTVPSELVERFQKEEKAAARRKKLQQTEHLFMNVRVASDTSVSNLRRYTKNADFSAFSNSACLRIRMKRTGPIRELYHRIYRRTGVPVARQRLWKVITRENRTHRPDQPLLANTLDFRVGSLIDDDASPKAPVRLYLQILGSGKPGKPVIHHHLWNEFWPPESESEKEDAEDELEAEDDAETEHPKTTQVDVDSVGCCQKPLHEHEILLFIKFYDLKRSLPERLRYVGNIVIDARRTGAQLSTFVHEALDIPVSKELILYEEIQPISIQEIEMNTSLAAAEIQHGDIICFQYAEDEAKSRGSLVINPELVVDEDASDALDGSTDVKLVSPDEDEERALDAVLTPANKPHEKYPDVPSYFRYLLDRVEIIFQQYGHPEEKFVLELLNSNVYDEIICAVAKHVNMTGDKRLFLRLYQHSPLNGLPMKTPLRHSQFSGDTRTTLEDFLSEYLERTTTMYYEILPCPITEIEAKKQVLVYLSAYDECFTHGQSHGQMHRIEFLVTATDTVSELMELVRDHFKLPSTIKLRMSEVTQHGSLITDVLDDDASLNRFWTGNNTSHNTGSNDASALLIECVVGEEDVQEIDEKVTAGSEPNELFVMGVTHFNFQANSQTWIHPHGVPLTISFREQDTVAQVKERIRRR